MHWNIQKMWKNILNIIDHNLKHDYQISIILGINISDTINCCLSFHLTQRLFLHYLGKTDQAKYALNWIEKTSINFIYPDLWPLIASRLQGLTVVQQCVYQRMFRNVYKFQK